VSGAYRLENRVSAAKNTFASRGDWIAPQVEPSAQAGAKPAPALGRPLKLSVPLIEGLVCADPINDLR